MTIEKWLSDVYYDDCGGTQIWNKEKDGGSQLVAEVRGWGAIQQLFGTHKECIEFQNSVGEFIVEAIKEKLQPLPKQELYTEEQVIKAMYQASLMSKQIGSRIMIDLQDITDYIQSLKQHKQ